MGRIIFIVGLVIIVGLKVSAQKNIYSGYSYLEFVENKGQWDSTVKFRANLSTGSILMQKKGFMVLQNDTADLRRIHGLLHGEQQSRTISSGKAGTNNGLPAGGKSGNDVGAGGAPGSGSAKDPFLLHSHAYRVSFENANDGVQILPDKPQAAYNNYFIGDKRNWVSNCKIYQGILYKNIYDGIDLHYYTEQGFVKYDLIVHPGADPNKIILKYEGQDKLSIRKNQIYVKTSVGTVRELEPKSYQLNQQGRVEVPCSYTMLDANRIQFKIKNYSPDATLIIDPTEIFCSFTGSQSDNWGYTATYDNAGDFYVGGIVLQYSGWSGGLYGATPGAFQSTFQGGDGSEGGGILPDGSSLYYDYDVGIMKFSPNGTTKLYATYIGGSGDEQPHSMVCDPQGNLIVAGRTSSSDFPFAGGVPVFGQGGGFDLFVTKLNASGTQLLGSKRIGGTGNDGVNNSPKYVNAFGDGTVDLRLNYGDDGRSEVILDASNNIYLAACTRPGSKADFPIVGGFQPAFGGGDQDGVLLKLNPDISALLFSSYMGGSGTDAAFVLALNPLNNNIYVAGGTMSTDLKGTGAGVMNPSSNGGIDGFISVVSNDGSTLMRTTYFGTSATDMIYGIEFDKLGFPYITGTTYGVIPVVNSPFNQNSNQSSGKQFITKLKPDLSGVIYSANFGPGGTTYPNISPTAFLVDRCENVYVAGWGGGIDPQDKYKNATTAGLVTTAGAIKPATDGADFYFFVLQKNAASQLYGSFFGQQGGELGDHVDGGTSRFDKQGVIYEAICANCSGGANFPTTPGAAYSVNGALYNGGCNEAAVKIAFNFAGVSAGVKVSVNGHDNDTSNCIPLNAVFQDTVRNAKSYIWDFGDGTAPLATTNYEAPHTYTATGVYTVRLIAIDSNSCNVSDTVYTHVRAGDNPASLAFTYIKGDCHSNDYTFINGSTYTGKPFTQSSFIWDFGDGQQAPSGVGDVTHSYASAGTYTVKLILNDTDYCNSPDTLSKKLTITPFVRARFATPPTGCAPYNAQFTNNSVGGQQFFWDFGDGNTSTSSGDPTNLYPAPGTFTIKLTVIDSSTCNIISDTSLTITVSGKPTAAFSFSPQPPIVNTPTTFTNESVGGVRYEWLFGDGVSTVKLTMDTVIHQYERTDTFQACLVVTNQYGCQDTACHPVAALINPLLDVPNAFTPGRFGQNGIVKVVGFGITQLVFRIYNRWGQLVFESNDPALGWDGTFKGVLQPMDVYAYTVEAKYFDGTHATKKGDITLLR